MRMPTLISFVLDAPVEALLGWQLLVERLATLPERIELQEMPPGESESLDSALATLDLLVASRPLEPEELHSSHPTLIQACAEGRVSQLLLYGALDQHRIQGLADAYRLFEVLLQHQAHGFAAKFLGLGPQSYWLDGALLGLHLLRHMLHQCGVAAPPLSEYEELEN